MGQGLCFLSLIFSGFLAQAALPPQYSECLHQDSLSSLNVVSVYDLKEIAKNSKVIYCENQVSAVGKSDTIDLLKSHVDIGISLARTNYFKEDLIQMAAAGPYLLYVDNANIGRDSLIDIAKAGAQLVIMSATAGLTQSDLLTIAQAKPFIYHVNSAIPKDNLKALLDAKVQLVISSSSSNISRGDLVALGTGDPAAITIIP